MCKEGICQIWILRFLRSKRSNLEVWKKWGVNAEMSPYLRRHVPCQISDFSVKCRGRHFGCETEATGQIPPTRNNGSNSAGFERATADSGMETDNLATQVLPCSVGQWIWSVYSSPWSSTLENVQPRFVCLLKNPFPRRSKLFYSQTASHSERASPFAPTWAVCRFNKHNLLPLDWLQKLRKCTRLFSEECACLSAAKLKASPTALWVFGGHCNPSTKNLTAVFALKGRKFCTFPATGSASGHPKVRPAMNAASRWLCQAFSHAHTTVYVC